MYFPAAARPSRAGRVVQCVAVCLQFSRCGRSHDQVPPMTFSIAPRFFSFFFSFVLLKLTVSRELSWYTVPGFVRHEKLVSGRVGKAGFHKRRSRSRETDKDKRKAFCARRDECVFPLWLVAGQERV